MKSGHLVSVGLVASLCVATLVVPSARATHVWVPGDQPTIQAGIDAAVEGDTVFVLMGTYSGAGNHDIDFKGKKKIWVYGLGGADKTIIDCGGSSTEHHGGFIFQTGEDSTCSLSGFTILNAWYPLLYNDSGAISIRGNSGPVVSFCTIANNHANGITITSSSAPKLIRNKISFNSGWGIWMPGYPYLSVGVQIVQCQIDYNVLGGVILTRAVALTNVTSNTIADNGGPGLFLQGDLPKQGTTVDWDTTTIIERNILAFNAGNGLYRMGYFTGVHFYRNDIYGNGSDQLGGNLDTVCIISADPLFCRQGGNSEYTLSSGSPCLAANNVCGVDMGAFVGQGCTNCCIGMRGNIDCDPSFNVDIADLTRLVDYLYLSYDPLCCEAAANVDATGLVDISDLTRLVDYLYLSLTPLESCQ
jgi:parallel beta-helix repeat protein